MSKTHATDLELIAARLNSYSGLAFELASLLDRPGNHDKPLVRTFYAIGYALEAENAAVTSVAVAIHRAD